MEKQKLRAHTLSGYKLLDDPRQPGVAGIAFKTDEGVTVFAATRDMLEQLADAFREQAAKMPELPEAGPKA